MEVSCEGLLSIPTTNVLPYNESDSYLSKEGGVYGTDYNDITIYCSMQALARGVL